MTLTSEYLVRHFINQYEINREWAPEGEISLRVPLIDFIKFLYMNNYHLSEFRLSPIGKNIQFINPANDSNAKKLKKRLEKLARILFQEQAQPAPIYDITQFENVLMGQESVPTFTGYDAKHPERRYFHITIVKEENQPASVILELPWFVNNKHGVSQYEQMKLFFSPNIVHPEIVGVFNERFAKYCFRLINYTSRSHLPRFLFD